MTKPALPKNPRYEREQTFAKHLKKRYFSDVPLMEVRSFDRFFMIPDWLAVQPDVSFGAMAIYGSLLLSAFEEGVAWMSIDNLSANFSVSDRTIRTILEELERHGLIARKRRRNRSTVIGILPHPWSGGRVSLPAQESRQRIDNGRYLPLSEKRERKISSTQEPRERKISSTAADSYPYCVNRREKVGEEHTHTHPAPPAHSPEPDGPEGTNHSPLLSKSESERSEVPNSPVTEDSTDYRDFSTEPNDQGTLRNFNVSDCAAYGDFTLVMRQVRARNVKAVTTSKQRLVMEEAWDRAIAKYPVGVDELRARYERFVAWCADKSGVVDAVKFLSKGIDSWDLRDYAPPAPRIAAVRPQGASAQPTAPKAPAARPGLILREVWNECCPDSPIDETAERLDGWRQWIWKSEFVDNFREIATLAHACRKSGCGFLTLGYLLKKQDGNALWNWQRLLNGDFSPREKTAKSVVRTDDDAVIREVMEDGVRQEKQLRDKLRREWIQKNLEREEDGLKPKPKPTKLIELEAKHGEN